MEHVYAFIDESGAFGWNIDKPSVSTHFIITAIIVKDCNLPICRKALEEIRLKYFSGSEIKSSKVKSNHKRRVKILEELNNIPYEYFSICVDKKIMYGTHEF